jgi:hypothetical protein
MPRFRNEFAAVLVQLLDVDRLSVHEPAKQPYNSAGESKDQQTCNRVLEEVPSLTRPAPKQSLRTEHDDEEDYEDDRSPACEQHGSAPGSAFLNFVHDHFKEFVSRHVHIRYFDMNGRNVENPPQRIGDARGYRLSCEVLFTISDL